MKHARHQPLRRAATYSLLAAALGLFSLTLTQCTMVGDNVTKVDLAHGERSVCEKSCDDAAKAALEIEYRRHQSATAACNDRPRSERQACRNAENALFFQNLRNIYEAWRTCRSQCLHHQGGGGGNN